MIPGLLNWTRRVPSDSLQDKDRLSMDFPESEASLIARQARSELLDCVAGFCGLERWETEDQRKVMGMKHLIYHDPSRACINLAVPWHCVAEEIADSSFDIVTGKLNKRTANRTNSGGQPFFLVYKHPDDPREQVDISSGSFSIHASQLVKHEALAIKTG